MTSPNDSINKEVLRRAYLKGFAGAAGTVAVAGCLGGGNGSGGNGSGGNGSGGNGSGGNGGGSNEQLTVLHGWTGGDGKDAITAMIEGFKKKYPDLNANFNAVGGTGNVQLNTLVTQKLNNNNPPSSWAAWPGAHLTPFVEGDLLGNIGESVWSKNNMKEAYVEEGKQLSKFNGNYKCVPMGSHRMNNLFYNKNVIDKAGVNPENLSSPTDLVNALDQIEKKTDAVGMSKSMVNSTTIMRLWAATLLGSEGFQAYMDVINGNADMKTVKNSLKATKKLTQYFPNDAASLDPPGSFQMIAKGEAGVLQTGNWVAGYLTGKGKKYKEDWGWAAYPGTKGMYGLHFDAFVYPKNAPAPQATINWLRYCGTKEAQVAYNTRKGSIPPRTDIPMEQFGPYLKDTIKDFQNAEHKPPTIADGLAVPPSTLSDLGSVFTDNFMGPFDVNATAKGILDAIEQNSS